MLPVFSYLFIDSLVDIAYAPGPVRMIVSVAVMYIHVLRIRDSRPTITYPFLCSNSRAGPDEWRKSASVRGGLKQCQRLISRPPPSQRPPSNHLLAPYLNLHKRCCTSCTSCICPYGLCRLFQLLMNLAVAIIIPAFTRNARSQFIV